MLLIVGCRTSENMNEIKNPRIVVKKAERTIELFDGETPVRKYRAVLGFAPVGDKERNGDGKTPEGDFYIFVKNDKSKYHLSLGVSYPDAADAERGLAAGLITEAERDAIVNAISEKRMPPQNTALGGEIYIHGGGIERDWTWGCVAVGNEEMTELFNAARVGTPVSILP